VNRVQAQEEIDAEAARQVRLAAEAATAREWAERRETVRQRDYHQADRLRNLVDAVLDEAPKFLQTRSRIIPARDGHPEREIITIAINTGVAIQAATVASKLQRLAAEMETEHTVSDVITNESLDAIREKRWARVERILAEAEQGSEAPAAAAPVQAEDTLETGQEPGIEPPAAEGIDA
jgi:hypothetical protein